MAMSRLNGLPSELQMIGVSDRLTWMLSWTQIAYASSWLSYTFLDNQAHVVEAYCITSANDYPARDPACWELRASMNANANEDSNSEWFALYV
eukprot:jgi/Chlat1/6702/Chrsp5S06986